MKKLNLLVLAFVALFAFSCNNTTEATEETVEETIEEEVVAVEEEVMAESKSSVELPSFENKEFNDFAVEMDELLSKTITLLKAGDQEGVAALEPAGKALQEKGMALEAVINDADKALFEEYMQAKGKELMTAAGVNMPSEEEIDHSGHNH